MERAPLRLPQDPSTDSLHDRAGFIVLPLLCAQRGFPFRRSAGRGVGCWASVVRTLLLSTLGTPLARFHVCTPFRVFGFVYVPTRPPRATQDSVVVSVENLESAG